MTGNRILSQIRNSSVLLEGREHNPLEVKCLRLNQMATGRSISNWKGCVLLDPIPGSKWAWEVCTKKRVTASSKAGLEEGALPAW